MELRENFERAKRITESWPDWKRAYQLTKNSEGLPSDQLNHSGTTENNEKECILPQNDS